MIGVKYPVEIALAKPLLAAIQLSTEEQLYRLR
jgi:hypothetical protein